MFYSAMVCSFIPYATRLATEKGLGLQTVDYSVNVPLGMLNGMAIMGLCLSWEMSYIASGGLIGATLAALYTA